MRTGEKERPRARDREKEGGRESAEETCLRERGRWRAQGRGRVGGRPQDNVRWRRQFYQCRFRSRRGRLDSAVQNKYEYALELGVMIEDSSLRFEG